MDLPRVIQYLTVFILFTIFLFSPIITLLVFILLSWFWSLSITLTICILYGGWIYFDRYTDSQGGRWSDRLRQLSICTYFTDYFPLKLIKSEDLDPNRNYIFGFHPHGAFSFGALGNFGTDATYFSTLFPNIRPHLMLLHLQFLFPFTREILLNLGACCVSKDSCEYFLNGKHGQGHALVIIIGGAREMYLTKNDSMILYLKNRKGFVTSALQHGYVSVLRN
jgi:2-acylglycerol O-acyltransferase 2